MGDRDRGHFNRGKKVRLELPRDKLHEISKQVLGSYPYAYRCCDGGLLCWGALDSLELRSTGRVGWSLSHKLPQ